jgi:hypothetical protein
MSYRWGRVVLCRQTSWDGPIAHTGSPTEYIDKDSYFLELILNWNWPEGAVRWSWRRWTWIRQFVHMLKSSYDRSDSTKFWFGKPILTFPAQFTCTCRASFHCSRSLCFSSDFVSRSTTIAHWMATSLRAIAPRNTAVIALEETGRVKVRTVQTLCVY